MCARFCAEGWGAVVNRHKVAVLVECGEKSRGGAIKLMFPENILTDVGKC